jgi:ElaB/YqjD/DUF883 family membrane-anchored ribosome-binding protein
MRVAPSVATSETRGPKMDIDRIRNVAGGFADSAKSQARDQASRAGASAEEAMGQAKGVARNVADSASELAGQAYDRGGQYLREGNRAIARNVGDNTLTALAVAGALGYFLSYLLHARH